MILTLNYIIDRFKDFAEKHGNINDFVFGDIQDSKSRNYPLLNVTLEAPSYILQGDRSLTPQISLTFKVVDRITTLDNEENGYLSTNEDEIYSDNYQYMLDVTQHIRSNLSPQLGLNVRTEDLITVDPVRQLNEDDVCGWESDMLFTTKYLNCEIPGITSGPSPANINTVTNNYITCATLPTCQTIIDIENDITNLQQGGGSNYYTTSASLNGNIIEFDRTDTSNAYSVDLSPILTSQDNYTTAASLSGNVIQFDRTDGLNLFSVDLTSILFDGQYSSLTGQPTLLSQFTNDVGYITSYTDTNDYTTGATLSGNSIVFDRTDTIGAYQVDLSPILPTPGLTCGDLDSCQTIIDMNSEIINNLLNRIDSAQLNGNIIEYKNVTSTILFTTDLSTLPGSSNDYTTGVTLSGNILTFDRTDSLSAYSVDLSSISGLSCADLPTCQTIMDIQSNLSTNTTNISNLQTDVSNLQTDVSNNTNNISNISNNDTDITNLQNSVSDLETYTVETKTNNYNLTAADAGKLIRSNASFDITFGINNDFNIGEYVEFNRRGTGELTIAPFSGVTILYTPGNRLNSQYSGATLVKTGTSEYTLMGDLK